MILKFVILSLLSTSILGYPFNGNVVETTNAATTARQLIHKSSKYKIEYIPMIQINIFSTIDWTSMGTIASMDPIKGFPMARIVSVADSALHAKSTGNVYFYSLEVSSVTKDLRADNRVTVTFTDDQDLSCTNRGIDTMEPTCPRAMITGYAVQVLLIFTVSCRI